MRLRNIRGSKESIQGSEFVIQNPREYRGRWSQVFENTNPIHIEVGMGKGKFITKLAIENPHINYIGIEKYSSVLVRALEKRQEVQLSNLVFIRMDAEYINEVFEKDEIERIYLNFSDPWPKDRHAKRRLTSKEFFHRYDNILKKEGRVEFKTDNKELFEFSLEEVVNAEWKLVNSTFDLHHDSQMSIGNIMTEYEEKFSLKGSPICKLIAMR